MKWRNEDDGDDDDDIQVMKKEAELLVESRRNIDHALAQTERPLRVYSKCK